MKLLNITIKIEARFIGKIQYPSTHTLCKNETFPPNILAFNVTTIAPPHIIRKIVPNKESAPCYAWIPKVLRNGKNFYI